MGLIVSPPLISRVTGKYAVPIARARREAGGEFIGAVVATIDTAFFVEVWTMDQDDQAISFEFLRRDGRLIMRVPFAPAAIDVVLPSSPYSNDTVATGIFRTSNSVDGVSRLAAFHQLSVDRNYVIVVGQTLESAFASWWRALWVSLPAWAGTTGLLGGLALWLARTWRSREMAELENRRVFETSEDVILVTDGRGKIVRVNPSVGKRLGYRPDEVVGHDVSEFVASQDVERTRKELQAATARNAPLNLKARYVHKDGHAVPFNWVGAHSESDGRSYFIGRDTTDQDRIEAQLRQSQKMESIGQLTGGIAHDFNDILMVILANVDALREEEEDVQSEVQSGLDEIAKGTGLGLSMVYGFVKQSGGHIKIYSEPGHGTTVRIYLRCSEGARPQAAGAAAYPMPRGNERVLVVEDSEQVRAAVVRQVESLGYLVTEASDGAPGLAACEATAQPYDLLLTDVIMPGPLNGRALADEVTRRCPTTRVLFMSGYTESTIIRHGRLEPGVQLLAKPFRKADLAQAIRRVLDGTRV